MEGRAGTGGLDFSNPRTSPRGRPAVGIRISHAPPEAGLVIEAVAIQPGGEHDPEQLLRAPALPEKLVVRNWRPGDRYWPAHTKAARNVKELLQDRHISGRQRKTWPVLACDNEIVWLRGFPLAARWQARPGENAFLIRERRIEE